MVDSVLVHHLFNGINQTKPWFFLDLRNDTAISKCRFRRSVRLEPSSCTNMQAVTDSMSVIRDTNKIDLIYVIDDSVPESLVHDAAQAAQKWTEEAQSSEEPWARRWRNVMSFKYIRFDHFYAAYPNCSSLYLGSDFPKNKESTPGSTYPTDIVPQFLYLGSFYDATDKAIMTELGFTHVIDATSEHMSAQTSQELGLHYMHIPVWDMEGVNIAEHFPSVLSFIHAAKDRNGKILVHCRAGISRSATLVMAYLMHAGLVQNLKDALELVIDQRPYIMPNPSFRTQLLDYEMTILRRQSFEDEGKMQEFMATINFCWSGIFTRETDHDKIPIIAATQRININRLLDAYPAVDDTAVATSGDGDNAAGTKPKKAFLKRGEGKAVATRLKQPATRCASTSTSAAAAAPAAASTPVAAAAEVTEYAAAGESVGASD